MSARMKLTDPRFDQRLQARLISNAEAVRAIESQLGIDLRIAKRFHLGLSERYPKSAISAREVVHQDALSAPIVGADGSFLNRRVYQHLASVTIDNRLMPPESWSAGTCETYFSRKRGTDDSLIVCDDMCDLWALVAIMHGTALDRTHVVIAPTHRRTWPDSWKDPDFWAQWKRINIAVAADSPDHAEVGAERDTRARELGAMIGRDVYRVMPHEKASWLAARLDGIRFDTFHRLLKDATLLKAIDLRRDEAKRYSSASGEDLSCSYHRGFLYEALRVLETEVVNGQQTQRLRTIVVRSDRTRHVAEEMPAQPDTPKSDRVHRLVPDGALLQRPPTPSSDSTWRWISARAFIYEDATAPPLELLLRQIAAHLRSSVWLPHQSDYLVLACVVAATYCQQIFDAVPLVLVTGSKGSGKTELSSAICRVAANSPGPVGLISAATLTRLVDASHGFIAIDDLEKLMALRGSDPVFSDLAQALKLSYKKESAQRMLTDVNRNNMLQRLNFYGIKLINNTQGVDEILGSRMLTISTRAMPAGHKLPRDGRLDREQCAQLRDHLHVWAFSHVDAIARTYASIFPEVSTRDVEIFAPIRVLAQLSGSEPLIREVDDALATTRSSSSTTPSEAMEDALLGILTRAIANHRRLPTVITVLETQMRLRIQEGVHARKFSSAAQSDLDSPEWIGRQLDRKSVV